MSFLLLRPCLRLATVCCLLICVGCGTDGGSNPPASAESPVPAGDQLRTVTAGGRTRTFIVHVPPGVLRNTAVSVVYVLHGRYGTGVQAQTSYGFDAIADVRGLVIIYPDGVDNSWNDGRGSTPAAISGVGDIAFFDAMDADLRGFLTVDNLRIFSCGMSNGAVMSQRLAAERADRFAAVGSVAGLMPEALAAAYAPVEPISCVLIHGTADTLSPYYGGESGSGGVVLSAAATVGLHRTADGITAAPTVTVLPDTNGSDGCTVDLLAADGGMLVTSVWLYRINGGGHTWAGHPGFDIGNVCLDIDATTVLCDFFRDHPKPGNSG